MNQETKKGPIWISNISNPIGGLLVVAHPDDEIIFAGGLVLSLKGFHWTIICCIPENRERRDEFYCACSFLAKESGSHIDPVVLGFEEVDEASLVEHLKPHVAGYDIVITHNSQGEYGHEEHKLIHRSVLKSNINPNIWVFISPGSNNVNQEELKSKLPGGNIVITMNPETLILKRRIFQECYRSQATKYGYNLNGNLCLSDLRETLSWQFESGKEEFSFFK